MYLNEKRVQNKSTIAKGKPTIVISQHISLNISADEIPNVKIFQDLVEICVFQWTLQIHFLALQILFI